VICRISKATPLIFPEYQRWHLLFSRVFVILDTNIFHGVNMYQRAIFSRLTDLLRQQKSILLLGPRQTGKTTLARSLQLDLDISLIRPQLRQEYETNPDSLIGKIEALAATMTQKPLVLLDEVQKVPLLLDVVQDLIDRKVAQFILTGSSARKLRRASQDINLLPGRVIKLHMDPLSIQELPPVRCNLDFLLAYGSLPNIVSAESEALIAEELEAYASIYLEEEVRQEAVVRNISKFTKFLQLAAIESGRVINFTKISQQLGVAPPTIQEYFTILVDCLVAEEIKPLTKTRTRNRLVKSSKYLFFDLGIRRICAKEGVNYPESYRGYIFEQFIGLELLRFKHLSKPQMMLYFWKVHDGPEVDWVVELEGEYIPIEVKLAKTPSLQKDTKHLTTFLAEYPNAKRAYIICTCDYPIKLSDKIIALPWQRMLELFQ